VASFCQSNRTGHFAEVFLTGPISYQNFDQHILRDELEDLATKNPDRFNLWFTVDVSSNDGWEYSTGIL
jgi:hypothetical protein